MTKNGDLDKLIENLLFFLQKNLNQHDCKNQLIEIVLDLGRRPEARFISGPERDLENYFMAKSRLYDKANQ
jgi:stage III sporulation protein SpoIIIAA